MDPTRVNFEPEDTVLHIHAPHKHRSLIATPLREGEVVLLKDESDAIDWYCAQVLKVSKSRRFQPYPSTNKTRHNRCKQVLRNE